VYGVQVPGIEGRAGCAAIVFRSDVTSQNGVKLVLQRAKANLPSYSVPVFLRIQKQTNTTGTFKHQKVALRKDGIDVGKLGDDEMFWLHPVQKEYVVFKPTDYESLLGNGSMRSKL